MKKTLAILCSLALIMSIVFVPSAFTVSAAESIPTNITEEDSIDVRDTDAINAGTYKSSAKTFDTALDMSGGKLALKYWGQKNSDSSVHMPTATIQINGRTFDMTQNLENKCLYVKYVPQYYILDLESQGFTDEDLKDVMGYSIQVGRRDDGLNTFYFQLVSIKPAIKASNFDGTVTLEASAVNAASHTLNRVTFDTPLDMSNSKGEIVLTHLDTISSGKIDARLWIHTANKTSDEWCFAPEWSTTVSGEQVTANISDMGLTDEDLKEVIGYTIRYRRAGAVNTYDFNVSFPKGSVKATYSEEYSIDTRNYSAAAGKFNTLNKVFDTALDMSGGKLALKYWGGMNYNNYITLYNSEIYINGKVLSIPNEKLLVTDVATYKILDLESAGFTDEDLKNIIGFKFNAAYSSGSTSTTFGFQIVSIKPSSKAAAFEGSVKSGSGYSAGTSKFQRVTFDTPLDLSDSKGELVFKHKTAITNAHVRIWLNTKNKTSDVINVLPEWSTIVAGDEVRIKFADIGLTEEDLKDVVGYTLRYRNKGTDSTRTYSFTASVEREPVKATCTEEDSIPELKSLAVGTFKAAKKTFAYPLDMSGGNYRIALKYWGKDTSVYMANSRIYINGKTFNIPNQRLDVTPEPTYIMLDLPSDEITDADLSNITGYDISAYIRQGFTKQVLNFQIVALKPSVHSDVIDEYITIDSGNWGNGTTEKTVIFDEMRDFSTNLGYINLSYSSNVGRVDADGTGMRIKLALYTANKTVVYDSAWFPYENRNEVVFSQINFEDLGLTEDNLKEVIGYKMRIAQKSDPSRVTYTLRVPSVVPKFDSKDNVDIPTDYVDGDLRFMPSTTVETVKSYYPYAVINDGENQVTEGIIKPGMTIKLVYNDEVIDTARVIVYDDLDMDGNFSATDLTVLRKTLLDTIELDEVQLATIKYHGYENTYDIRTLVRMKKMLVGLLEVGQVSSKEWTQDKFYLSSGRMPSSVEGLQNYKDLGYNMGQIIVGNTTDYDKLLKNIDAVGGIDTLVYDTTKYTVNNSNLSFSDSSIRKTVAQYNQYDSVKGYILCDEPIIDQFTTVKGVNDFLNKYDPNSIKYTCLLPSYNTVYTWANGEYEGYVQKFIKDCTPNVLTLDYYPYLMGTQKDGSDWWRDMGLFRSESIKNNIPFWYVYQGYKISDNKEDPTNEEIKYQMYVGLAYGAKRLSEWLATYDGITTNGTPTEKYEEVKARNAEIMNVGNFLFDKTSTAIYQTSSAFADTEKYYLDDISESTLLNSASEGLILSVFEDGETDTKYLLVVNRDTTNAVEGTITLKNQMNISELDSEENITADTISLNIAAGGGKVYILK